MRFKAIEVRNIRSYKKERVEFPEGSVVLAGDVGAGKSSLLLAMEFALFGIRRGELPGEALLRRGTRQGKVKLNLEVEGKDVTIVRELNQHGDSVRQDKGYIQINGSRKFKTPQELKAEVLKLLGYPMDLLTKQKSRIFRYTVYTPQESMNEIITEMDEEERLDTLRKVFRVDKYKRITENASSFLTDLRRMRDVLQPTFRDLEEKQDTRKMLQNQLDALNQTLETLHARKRSQEQHLEKLQEQKQAIKDQIELYNSLLQQLEVQKTNIQNKKDNLETLKREIQQIQEEIASIEALSRPTRKSVSDVRQELQTLRKEKDIWLESPTTISDAIEELEQRKNKIEQQITHNEGTIRERKAKIGTIEENIEKLQGETGTCPLCGQELSEAHRKEKLAEFKANIEAIEGTIAELRSTITTLKEQKEEAKNEKQEKINQAVRNVKVQIKEHEQLLEVLTEFKRKQDRKKEYLAELKEKQEKKDGLLQDISTLRDEKETIKTKVQQLKDVKEKETEIEQQLDAQRNKVSELKRQITAKEKDKEHLRAEIDRLTEEITDMQDRKAFWDTLGAYLSWIDHHFIGLIDTIETHFLARMHQQFDPRFRKWFNFLIDEEGLNARVDRKFTPLILQEGYEAPYTTLSGGERASVALAYRLALNTVINTQIENIRTKDVIILDEPTDGFSDQQLDKVRDIIHRIDIPQIIIVSHERKVKDYVDKTIEIQKEEGVSRQVS